MYISPPCERIVVVECKTDRGMWKVLGPALCPCAPERGEHPGEREKKEPQCHAVQCNVQVH